MAGEDSSGLPGVGKMPPGGHPALRLCFGRSPLKKVRGTFSSAPADPASRHKPDEQFAGLALRRAQPEFQIRETCRPARPGQQRLQAGLPPMEVSDKLNTSAQRWTQVMVDTGNFAHGSNQAFSNRLLAVDYNCEEGGENIATGFETPRDVVAGCMASQEHCQNILDPDYRSMGTGVVTKPVGNWASDPSTWTQDFGLVMGHSNPSRNYGPQQGCPYRV